MGNNTQAPQQAGPNYQQRPQMGPIPQGDMHGTNPGTTGAAPLPSTMGQFPLNPGGTPMMHSNGPAMRNPDMGNVNMGVSGEMQMPTGIVGTNPAIPPPMTAQGSSGATSPFRQMTGK